MIYVDDDADRVRLEEMKNQSEKMLPVGWAARELFEPRRYHRRRDELMP